MSYFVEEKLKRASEHAGVYPEELDAELAVILTELADEFIAESESAFKGRVASDEYFWEDVDAAFKDYTPCGCDE